MTTHHLTTTTAYLPPVTTGDDEGIPDLDPDDLDLGDHIDDELVELLDDDGPTPIHAPESENGPRSIVRSGHTAVRTVTYQMGRHTRTKTVTVISTLCPPGSACPCRNR